ncbi:MarR family transcriptional regulator [bacterium]|jgi:DNA-binding MarR family transcriptional regulator|nr:MarR family transcriptional regulator [bacterium]
MNSFEQRARELAEHVHSIVVQQRAIEASAATNPNLDISRQELLAIEMLGESGHSIMRALADQLSLAVNTVTTLVDNLEKRDFVRRLRDEQDRRLVWVQLTVEGQKAFAALQEERHRLCRALLGSLNEDEQEIYLVITRKIARQARSFVAGKPTPKEDGASPRAERTRTKSTS